MITVSNLISRCQIYTNNISTRIENSDWYDFFNATIREIRRSRTFPWQKKETTLEFFTDVFKYQLPSDFDSIIKPHATLLESDEFSQYHIYGRENEFFTNNNVDFALSWLQGTLCLLSRIEGTANEKLEGFDDEISEYTASGDANSLVSDNVYFREGTSSLRFNITNVSGIATLLRTIITAVDLTDYLEKGKLFLWVYMPTVLISITIRWGSSSTNYYTATVIIDAVGNSFQVGWNLLKFDMNGAIKINNPDIANINYWQIDLNHTGITDTDFRVDGLYFRLPTIMDFSYNSKYIITNGAGAQQESIADVTDIILGDVTFEEIIMWGSILKASKYKLKDADLIQLANDEFIRSLIDLNKRYPTLESPIQSNYYKRFRDF